MTQAKTLTHAIFNGFEAANIRVPASLVAMIEFHIIDYLNRQAQDILKNKETIDVTSKELVEMITGAL